MFIFLQPLSKANFRRVFSKINNPADAGFIKSLRRGGDSNPRYSFPYGSLANCWFKPLTHLSNNKFLLATLALCSFSEGGSPTSPKSGDLIYGARQKYENKHKVQNKSDFYLKPPNRSVINLKFSRVSSSKSATLTFSSFTSDRNLLSIKFRGSSFSLTYTEFGTVIPSLLFKI